MSSNSYDFIGDIHGHARELRSLLNKLGYKKKRGIYQHPSRTAIFVGDLIDRGPENLGVVNIVKKMVDAGAAQAILGNHEYNAIGYHSININGNRKFLRKHSEKNTLQHIDFLEEQTVYPSEAGAAIEWFKTLPLFIENAGFRCIHACWDQNIINNIKSSLNPDHTMPEDFFVKSFIPATNEHEAIESLLKGPEEKLYGKDTPLIDSDGNYRNTRRIKWWNDASASERQDIEAPVTFIGHYWLTGRPTPLTTKLCCVDYSIAKKGFLACYRWDGETSMSAGKFVVEPHMENFNLGKPY